MLSGNAFHSTGAPTLRDLYAKVLHLVIGLNNKLALWDDLSPSLLCGCKWIKSCNYFGHILLIHLWVRVNILYCILCFMGSQCNSFRHSVMLFLIPRLSVKRAHMCCIL